MKTAKENAMNPTHALTSDRPGRLDRRRPACLLSLLLLAAAGSVQGAPRCKELQTSLLAEPEWHFRECLVNPNALDAVPPTEKAGTDTAYAQDLSPVSDHFVSHNLNNFPGQSVVGSSTRLLFGYDFDPTATTLYALANDTFELGTVNLATGAFTAIGPSVPLSGHVWTGLSIHPATGTFYASSANLAMGISSLYTLNPATGFASLVGSDPSVDAIIDIAVNCAGQMYGHDIASDAIYQINPATGLATFVGATGIDSNFAQGMDFDNESGVLYAWTYQGTGNNRYGTINLTTGALTSLSINNPLGQFEGATQTTCDGVMPPVIFIDGFETGDIRRWSL
jgi:Repeat of unknown function (DUF6923)